jgi:hypothetical protein
LPTYTVKQGDCISSIADRMGFFWDTLWNDPNNADLRNRRKNPNALLPGDTVFIPVKRGKEESCSPTKRHTFRIRGIPVRFNLRLLDQDGNPRAGVPYSLQIDGKKTQGALPADGNLSEIIAANAKNATLTLRPPGMPEEVYNFQLGYMNPHDDAGGIQGRLKNLGHYNGEINSNIDDETIEAIKKFQKQAGLPETGDVDDATHSALAELHGG